MRSYRTAIFTAFLLIFSACTSTQNIQHPTMQGTLWVQNAAEYDALTLQAYQQAKRLLEPAVTDSLWTASVVQKGEEVKSLQPAVILDIDETVLDNSPFQARMIEQNSSFNPDEWTQWVLEENADAIAGALEFTRAAAEKDIAVFYISNRGAETEEATRNNMERLGFPLNKNRDTVLLNGEQDGWNSDKINRRAVVEQDYRVIMLFGDDLNDFLPAKNITQDERDLLVRKHADHWGKKWFVFPNPTYGSWEQALFNFQSGLSDDERERIFRDKLNKK